MAQVAVGLGANISKDHSLSRSAVTVGLVFGKIWLAVGWCEAPHYRRGTRDWIIVVGGTLAKSGLCAVGASLNEAGLTGGNDNIVVLVVL